MVRVCRVAVLGQMQWPRRGCNQGPVCWRKAWGAQQDCGQGEQSAATCNMVSIPVVVAMTASGLFSTRRPTTLDLSNSASARVPSPTQRTLER
eukprot:6941013-Alexandrium_andersonii.AAC.1